MYITSRFQYIQDATHLVMVGEQLTTHPYRIIPLDGRPHIGAIPMWNGDPRGHWEGDTLVVETRNQNAKYMLDQQGRFITDEARIVERFTRIENDTIHYRATFDDPNVYTMPFTLAFAFRRNVPEIWEEACFETNTEPMRLVSTCNRESPSPARSWTWNGSTPTRACPLRSRTRTAKCRRGRSRSPVRTISFAGAGGVPTCRSARRSR